jgi:protein involved in ribonucleotide reduction
MTQILLNQEKYRRLLGSIASGAGNFIGAFRPGANIYRNDYGPRNTTIYNGR